MSQHATNLRCEHEDASPPTRAFAQGKVDPVEAGRRGGIASGIARRLKPLRDLERGVIESRNGAAKVKLLEQKQKELAALEREQARVRPGLAIDPHMLELRVQAVERRELALKANLQTSAGLAALLAGVPEQRIEEALIVLGLVADEGER
jgi:hypothetical protein